MADGTSKQELELSPGDVCDGYRIVALIAAGGMGDVYEAVHDITGKTVAVKCLKVRHRNKEDARARMKMEAVVLSELQHENLVQVYDAGVTDAGMVWIAMERLHGRTLRDVLFRAGQLPIADALYYASEIADGVDAVHEVNVIHRDLKPENIFVTDRQVVKVLDLGTGKFTGYGLNSTDRMRVIGTTAYMSPEQIKGLRVDARADVYALGLMVYEMIAGRHALTLDDGVAGLPQAIEQIALMQLQMTPKPLFEVAADCPRYVSAIVDKAITKERDRRYPSMTAFARDLRGTRKRFVAEHQIEAALPWAEGEGLREKFGAPPRPSSHPPRPARRVSALPPDEIEVPMDDFQTEIQAPLQFTDDVSGPVPAHVPTLELSSASLSVALPGLAVSDFTDRVAPPDDVRNRTTHTNPIGFVRSTDLSPTDLSAAGIKRRSRLAVWAHPMVRRAAMTLGLGALIGVPPAVIGVLWSAHRRADASLSASSPVSTTSRGVVDPALAPAEPLPVAVALPSAVAAEPPARASALAATSSVSAEPRRVRPKSPPPRAAAVASAGQASREAPSPKTNLPPSGL